MLASYPTLFSRLRFRDIYMLEHRRRAHQSLCQGHPKFPPTTSESESPYASRPTHLSYVSSRSRLRPSLRAPSQSRLPFSTNHFNMGRYHTARRLFIYNICAWQAISPISLGSFTIEPILISMLPCYRPIVCSNRMPVMGRVCATSSPVGVLVV
jgi:hypothetical protein